MKLYSALIKKNDEEKISDIVLLRDGFSLSAFLFSGLWFLYHRMWREFLVVLLVNVVITYCDKFSTFDKVFLQLSLALLIAINANQWLVDHLRKHDHTIAGFALGGDKDEAKMQFITSMKLKISDLAPVA